MNNKLIRYIGGFVFLALIIASFYHNVFLLIISAIFIILTMAEYRSMFKKKGIWVHPLIPELTGVLASFAFVFDYNGTSVLIFGCILSFILTIIINKKPYFMTSMTAICSILFIFCGLYIIKLLQAFDSEEAVIIYFAAVLAGDFVASKIGQKLKSKYIVPEISPNKTLYGFISSFITTVILCLLLKPVCNTGIPYCIIIGITISVFAQLGDLTLSTIKRDLEIKHSSSLFADYGGIWDRIDSFIFSAPALYYLLALID